MSCVAVTQKEVPPGKNLVQHPRVLGPIVVVVVVDVLVVVDGGTVVGGGSTKPQGSSKDSHVVAGRSKPPGLGQGQLEGQLFATSTHCLAELALYLHFLTSQGLGVVVLQHAQGGNVVVGPPVDVGGVTTSQGVEVNPPHTVGAGAPKSIGFAHVHRPNRVSVNPASTAGHMPQKCCQLKVSLGVPSSLSSLTATHLQ